MTSVSRPQVGIVAVTQAGRRLAQRLADALPARATVLSGKSAAEDLKNCFAQCDAVVAVMAAGAVVRILAPLVAAGNKASDPAILVVDEAGRFVIPILGGHVAGANRLAAELAEVLGAEAVLTTATDVAGVPGLDQLGWPISGNISGVSRALLDGEKVTLASVDRWPLPAFGENVVEVLGGGATGLGASDSLDSTDLGGPSSSVISCVFLSGTAPWCCGRHRWWWVWERAGESPPKRYADCSTARSRVPDWLSSRLLPLPPRRSRVTSRP